MQCNAQSTIPPYLSRMSCIINGKAYGQDSLFGDSLLVHYQNMDAFSSLPSNAVNSSMRCYARDISLRSLD
jgi:hypothetical protein